MSGQVAPVRAATVVVVDVTYKNGSKTLYGPFLPHAGSATTTLVWEMEHRDDVDLVVIRNVFIGAGESDATVVSA